MRIINAILTPRGIAALALVGIVLVFSYLSDIFELIFYILVFIMIAAFLADIALAPGPKAFRITRRFDPRMSLLEDNPVELEITNRGRLPVRMQIRDELPPHFRVDIRTISVVLPPNSRRDVKYYLHPVARGDFALERIHVRTLGPLGLVRVGFIIPEVNKFKVYPNLIALRRYRLLAKKDRLTFEGFRALKLKGRGTDFAQLRDYLPDDDFRRIDWKSSARRNKLTVREYQIERAQNLFIMLDCGRLSSSHLGGHPRLDTMINAALMLAFVALQSGDRVGLLAFDDDIRLYLPFEKGNRQLNRIIESLYNLQPAMVESDYRKAFNYVANKVRRRSMVTLFADIIDSVSSAQLLANVQNLAPKHLPLMLLMRDEDVDTISAERAEIPGELFRKVSAQNLLLDRRAALSKLTFRGVLALDLPPDKLSVEAVNGYLQLKARSLL